MKGKENSFVIKASKTTSPEITIILQHTGDPKQTTTVSFWDYEKLFLQISSKQFEKLVKGVAAENKPEFEIEVQQTLHYKITVIPQPTAISFMDCGKDFLVISLEEFKKLVDGVKEKWQGDSCPV